MAKKKDEEPTPAAPEQPKETTTMRKEFEVHRLNTLGMEKAQAIAETLDAALEKLEVVCEGGDGRCMALVRTKLEEACFFAKKAMATNRDNQGNG